MSCINPMHINVLINNKYRENYSIDCGHCLNCLVKKQSQLIFLAQKEQLYQYRAGNGCSFVTLTYDDSHLPINEYGYVTLRRKDVQLFIKNMRRQMEYYGIKKDFKYIYCGEYGDGSHSTSLTGVSTCRSHYHIVFLGLSDVEVKFYTRKLWKNGLCDVGVLSAGGLRYICKYMTKATPDKKVKEFREKYNVQNPFIYHSLGLGKQWIIDNMDKIVENHFTFNLNGKINFFPKYVCKFVAYHTGNPYKNEFLKFKQEQLMNEPKARGITFTQWDYEKSYIQYKQKVEVMRQKGMPVDDITLKKSYCRPSHSWDRTVLEQERQYVSNLVNQALA